MIGKGGAMNLNQIKYFIMLAEEEHYTRASKRLSIAQPSLSHAIAQLEKELNTRLFEKKGRNVVMTRYGRDFLPYARQSVSSLDEGVRKIRALNSPKEGEISLAYIYTLADRTAPSLARRFMDAYPDYTIRFRFTAGPTGRIIEGLKDDEFDIVLSSFQDGEPDVEFRKIGSQKLVVAVPKGHPLAARSGVTLKETIPYPQIFYSRNSGLRPVVNSLFEKQGLFPQIVYEVEADSGVAGLVSQGFGIAVMPDIPFLKTMDLKLLEITEPTYDRAIYAAWMQKHYLSPVAKAFLHFVIRETSGGDL